MMWIQLVLLASFVSVSSTKDAGSWASEVDGLSHIDLSRQLQRFSISSTTSKRGYSGKSSKGAKHEKLYRLAPFSCADSCIDASDADPTTGELTDAVKHCLPDVDEAKVSQQWIVRREDTFIKVESRYHEGKCIAVDYEPGDQPKEVNEACENGVLALLPCDNPAADWYKSGSRLLSSFCWFRGVPSVMHVYVDAESGECDSALQAKSYGINPWWPGLQTDIMPASTGDEFMFIESENFEADIHDVRKEIEQLIHDSERELIPKFLRLGFHDCIGGCDGCVDMANPDNKGLQEPIDAIADIVDRHKDRFSRADIWALATLGAAALSLVVMDENGELIDANHEGINFPMEFTGRKDCEDADERGVGGPSISMPSNDLTTHELLEFFRNEFDFDANETVSIMGAHVVAVATRDNLGFGNLGDEEEGWVFQAEDYILDHRYYDMLLGDDDNLVQGAPMWKLELVHNNDTVPDRYQWAHERKGMKERPIMTNADMAIVRDVTGHMTVDQFGNTGKVDCAFKEDDEGSESDEKPKPVVCPVASDTIEKALEYRNDKELFLSDFQRVLGKMLCNGYTDTELQPVVPKRS